MKQIQVGRSIGVLAASAVFCCATVLAQSGQAGAGSMQNGNSAAGQNQSANMQNMQNMQSSQSAPASDKMFLKKAMQGNLAEIQTAQLALQKSQNDQVKAFAQKMIDDHTKLQDQGKPVAEQLGVAIPTEPSKKDQAEMAKLQALSGNAFDKAYVKDMVKDHKMDNQMFQQEASNGQNPDVKNLAAQADPIIQNHLQMAQKLAQSMGGGGTSAM